MNKKLKAIFTLAGLGGIAAASVLANAPLAEGSTGCKRQMVSGCEQHASLPGWCGDNRCNGAGVTITARVNNWVASSSNNSTAYGSLFCQGNGGVVNVHRGAIYNGLVARCGGVAPTTGVDYCGASTSCQNVGP